MQKIPAKDMHTKKRGLWTEKLRAEPSFRGELTENRVRLAQLITTAQEKTLQISAILKEKVNEQTKLKKQLDAAFKKTPAIAHQKALAKTRMDLENHLHHIMRELDHKKMELKKIRNEVTCTKKHLSKELSYKKA